MEIIRKLFSIYESINSWVDIKYHQIASRLHVFICKLIFFMATNWEQFDLLYSICKHIWIFVKALLCFFHCGDSVAYVVDGSLIYYFHNLISTFPRWIQKRLWMWRWRNVSEGIFEVMNFSKSCWKLECHSVEELEMLASMNCSLNVKISENVWSRSDRETVVTLACLWHNIL